MAIDPSDPNAIQETDIVFDCPHCGKSLAVDYRGAGLTISCTDCKEDVMVPIPNGMEIGDLDSSPEDQEIRILNLRRMLSEAEERIGDLESNLEVITRRRDELEKSEADSRFRFGSIHERIGVIQHSLQEIEKALEGMAQTAGQG